MNELKIISNYQRRAMIYGYELTEKEKAEFDYLSPEELECHDFFRYKGEIYDPAEFERIDKRHFPELARNWDGVHNDSFFSGILVKYPVEEWGEIDTESIIVGWYYC